jgi:hypothetical protein
MLKTTYLGVEGSIFQTPTAPHDLEMKPSEVLARLLVVETKRPIGGAREGVRVKIR